MLNDFFKKNSFHDDCIHGIAFLTEDFESRLIFDLDHIVEWPNCATQDEHPANFKLVRAKLIFFNVTDLALGINWGRSKYTTSVMGLHIIRIAARVAETELRFAEYFEVLIETNLEDSQIKFGASAVKFEICGKPVEVARQYLKESERI